MGTSGLQFPGVDAAIAQFEGFGIPGSASTVANNPGNIIAGGFATSHGATGIYTTSGGTQLATFATPQAGAAAEDALVQNYAKQGYDISSLINAWAPASAPGNNAASTDNYVGFVSNQLGVSASTPLSQLVSQSPNSTSLPSPLPDLPFGQVGPTVTIPNQSNVSSPPLSQSFSTALNYIQSLFSPGNKGLSGFTQSGAAAVSNTALGVAGLSWGRIGGFLLGLILIVGALYLFKPTQEVIRSGARAARNTAGAALLA